MSNTHANYLYDLAQRFLEEALEAKRACESLGSKTPLEPDQYFQIGRAQAYYEVLSTVINLAYSFNLDTASFGLEGIDPDQLLLS